MGKKMKRCGSQDFSMDRKPRPTLGNQHQKNPTKGLEDHEERMCFSSREDDEMLEYFLFLWLRKSRHLNKGFLNITLWGLYFSVSFRCSQFQNSSKSDLFFFQKSKVHGSLVYYFLHQKRISFKYYSKLDYKQLDLVFDGDDRSGMPNTFSITICLKIWW